ncbi:MAG: UDP-N-acetylmuramate dehydrogenase [Syntrophobacteraceae bacterium]
MIEDCRTTTIAEGAFEQPMAVSRSNLFPVLHQVPDVEYSWDEPLACHTTFRVGGAVACLARPQTESALLALLEAIRKEGLSYIILGGGSNVVAPDAPLNLVAIKLDLCCSNIRPYAGNYAGGDQVYAGAGVRIAEWLRFCLRNRYSGMEFLVGIPGTLGGALVMNAGTKAGCIADALLRIDLLDGEGRPQRIDRGELSAQYRFMGLPKDSIVLGACFKLQPSSGSVLRETMAALMKQRKIAQPLGRPSAGCIFRNPPGLSAGELIDNAGLKGARIGDAEISQKHANWIINRGNAKAEDILKLIRMVEKHVLEKFGIRLEREVQIL